MALKLDNSLLEELGLGSLPEDEKTRLRQHIYETLEMRVGMRLADQMTDAQLDEFEQYVNAQDDAGAFKWLESNFPNYKDVVNDEFEKLKNEVRQVAPQILASGGMGGPAQAAQQAPAQQSAASVQSQPQPLQANPQYAAPQYQGQPAQPMQYQQPAASPQPVVEQPLYQQPDPALYAPAPGQAPAPAQSYAVPESGAPQQPPVAQPAQPYQPPYPQQQPPAGPQNGPQSQQPWPPQST